MRAQCGSCYQHWLPRKTTALLLPWPSLYVSSIPSSKSLDEGRSSDVGAVGAGGLVVDAHDTFGLGLGSVLNDVSVGFELASGLYHEYGASFLSRHLHIQ